MYIIIYVNLEEKNWNLFKLFKFFELVDYNYNLKIILIKNKNKIRIKFSIKNN